LLIEHRYYNFFLSGQGDVVVSLVLITQVAAMKLTTEEDVSLNID